MEIIQKKVLKAPSSIKFPSLNYCIYLLLKKQNTGNEGYIILLFSWKY